jgi:uncharacterized protein YdaU (DUF1376 family)
MHYYQHNIADYRKDTQHLTLLEHGLYRHMLDTYYLDEEPIKTEGVFRRFSVRTKEERQALENILSDFFNLSDCGKFYYHARCDDVIAKYKGKVDRARDNGKKGGRPKRGEKAAPDSLEGVKEDSLGGSGVTKEVVADNPEETKGVILDNLEGTQKKANSLTHKLTNSLTHEFINNNEKIKVKPLDQSEIDQKTIDELFDQFWSSGLPKVGKEKAKKSFNNILKKTQRDERAPFVAMLAADIRKRLSNKQFGFACTHPASYLNGKRWEDEFTRPADKRSAREEQEALHERLLRERGEDELGSAVVSVQ